MLTFSKSGWFVLIAAGVSFFTLGATQSVAAAKWISSVQTTELGDGTLLTEYVAETESTSSPDIRLRTVFIPRFACTPLTAFAVFDKSQFSFFPTSTGTRQLDFFIDDTPTAFPAVVDRSESVTEVQFTGSLARRVKLRLLLDSGRVASLKTSEQQWDFSLIGSTAVHEKAKLDCRNHAAEK